MKAIELLHYKEILKENKYVPGRMDVDYIEFSAILRHRGKEYNISNEDNELRLNNVLVKETHDNHITNLKLLLFIDFYKDLEETIEAKSGSSLRVFSKNVIDEYLINNNIISNLPSYSFIKNSLIVRNANQIVREFNLRRRIPVDMNETQLSVGDKIAYAVHGPALRVGEILQLQASRNPKEQLIKVKGNDCSRSGKILISDNVVKRAVKIE